MLQVRSILDVADNTGAKRAATIGVFARNQKYARVCDVMKRDVVVVICGAHRGKRGKIISVTKGNERVIVEGINMIKRHTRKSSRAAEGGIIEREGTVHLSNVMLGDIFDARAAKRPQSA